MLAPKISKPAKDTKPRIYVRELSSKKLPKWSFVRVKYIINAMNGIARRFKRWTPIAKPIKYVIKIRYFMLPGVSFSLDHFKTSHTTMAVKNVDRAYTSASTALNH